MPLKYYLLNDREPYEVGASEWRKVYEGRTYQNEPFRIARHEWKDAESTYISTGFLGFNPQQGYPTDPVFFETFINAAPYETQDRHETWEEAFNTHMAYVKQLTEALGPPARVLLSQEAERELAKPKDTVPTLFQLFNDPGKMTGDPVAFLSAAVKAVKNLRDDVDKITAKAAEEQDQAAVDPLSRARYDRGPREG